MRNCVIFNPAARGDKARRFRRQLDVIAADCTVKQTAAAGDARRLATQAIHEGCQTVVAAGGDGTLNEVLNGFGDVADGFERARLGVLPLGTVNVFARELRIPMRSEAAWEVIRRGRETRVDLPVVDFADGTGRARLHFAQLAGAGLDARAVELLDGSLKRRIGPLAYVVSAARAMAEVQPKITVTDGERTAEGALVLVGNGRLYGGPFAVFPEADLRDGLLELRIFPRITWPALARVIPGLMLRRSLSSRSVETLRAASFSLTSRSPVALELDGELIGHLPAEFRVRRLGLRVIVA